ncbi:MAG: ABC-three component system protein [Patescibacteria group bacterium]
MDPLTRAYYEWQFERAFLKRRGEEFQNLFASIMELRHPGDFQRTRPWGRIGDRKNDGYVKSTRTLFQVYGPNEIKPGATIAKIDEDFKEALAYWDQHLRAWVFMHNAQDGLSPPVHRRLLDLAAANPAKSITHWGYPELRGEAMALRADDLASLFGTAPTERAMLRLGVADLQPMLQQVARLPAAAQPDLRPVPPEKIRWNMLSSAVASMLTAGMHRSDLVGQYFRSRGQVDAHARDEVASAFASKYAELRDNGLAPDDIFDALRDHVGGRSRGTSAYEAAVLAVLAHFFEACDIFERPEAGGSA